MRPRCDSWEGDRHQTRVRPAGQRLRLREGQEVWKKDRFTPATGYSTFSCGGGDAVRASGRDAVHGRLAHPPADLRRPRERLRVLSFSSDARDDLDERRRRPRRRQEREGLRRDVVRAERPAARVEGLSRGAGPCDGVVRGGVPDGRSVRPVRAHLPDELPVLPARWRVQDLPHRAHRRRRAGGLSAPRLHDLPQRCDGRRRHRVLPSECDAAACEGTHSRVAFRLDLHTPWGAKSDTGEAHYHGVVQLCGLMYSCLLGSYFPANQSGPYARSW
mmetsp:Transcript_12119/g.28916  ORF Transcript_12119/g.28916 Transcript_12119/m.28916 type:complete len:274 (+) Transcript_12119:73-894(+)